MYDVVKPTIKVAKIGFRQRFGSVASTLVLYSKDPNVTKQLISYSKKAYLPSHHIVRVLFKDGLLNWKWYVYFFTFTTITRRYTGIREIVVYDISQKKFFSTCPMRCLNITLPSLRTIGGRIVKQTWWKKCFCYIFRNRLVKFCLKLVGFGALLYALYQLYCWYFNVEAININEYLWQILDCLDSFNNITEG